MEYKGILSNGDRLREKCFYKVTVKDETRDILIKISAQIHDAHKGNLSKIHYPLPVNFPIVDDNVSNATIQANVYYNLITELERNNYTVEIDATNEKRPILIVMWGQAPDTSEYDKMMKKITSKMRTYR